MGRMKKENRIPSINSPGCEGKVGFALRKVACFGSRPHKKERMIWRLASQGPVSSGALWNN